MNKNKKIQYLSIAVIIICVVIVGYIFLNPNTGQATPNSQSGLAPMVDGKQVIAMIVKAVSYEPNYFKVKVGVPVRWEITSSGQPGCDSGSMVANGLLDGAVYLNPNAGQVTVKEFTPQNVGTYRFTCPMGMVRGILEVVN